MRMKGGNEESTLYLSDLILSVFWGDIRCSGRKRWNQQEERNALQTHPEKKQGWKLLMMANKKTRMTTCYDGKRNDDVTYWFLSREASEGCSLVKVILYWRPSHLATWTQRQVAKWSSCKGRLSRKKRNFDRSELPGSETQICTPRWWELLVTIDT